jgi:hypothetical protein
LTIRPLVSRFDKRGGDRFTVGDAGASVISRVMGLILASVATASTLAGIKEYFAIQANSVTARRVSSCDRV